MTMPAPKDPAPVFTLACDEGADFDLAAERGHFVVLFFYPKDNTQGCTIENQDFTDLMPEFSERGVTLLGISPDSTTSHARFRAKYGLKPRLAADPDRVAIEAYGVWGEKKMAGRTYMGLKRTSFIVAPDGTIADVFANVKARGHAAAVLESIKALIG